MSRHKSKLHLNRAAQGDEGLFISEAGAEEGWEQGEGVGGRAIPLCYAEILVQRLALNSNDVAPRE